MADPEELEEWLKKADEDWRVADILLKSGEELTLPCMFHLQQMLVPSGATRPGTA